jgi:anaerobic ribonucleoside-triphosphate reductase
MVECVVCKKELKAKEGFISSTGVAVCGDSCKEEYMQRLPNEGKGSLEVYSRVTGYYTPVKSWNKGKQQEFKERNRYQMR